MPFLGDPGTVRVTADGALISSGKPVRVYHIHEIYGGSSAGSVLRNGTSASDTIYVQLTSTDSTGVSTDFGPHGVLFPSGCFYDEGTSVTSATIVCRLEN